jgi:hypothetical protein
LKRKEGRKEGNKRSKEGKKENVEGGSSKILKSRETIAENRRERNENIQGTKGRHSKREKWTYKEKDKSQNCLHS